MAVFGEQRPHSEAPSASVNWDAVSVCDQSSVRGRYETTEVVALTEDRASGGSGHNPTHMATDLIKAVLHQSQYHRIKFAGMML